MNIVHKDVGSLKKGSYMMMDGRACQIVSMERSAPGKHGHAKYRIMGVDLLTGTKKQAVYTGHDKVKVPIIEKKSAQVLSVSGNKVQIMDMESYETFELDIPDEFKGKIEENGEVTYWNILGEKVIKQVKSAE
ncbi:translation initiation factor IF-5A [Candidatus Woesearchaeota archaeon]|nr:translation initiation factor IF-5A [Candidatus Woesearchaeota archaeon]